jgi:hypothetical protein
MRRETPCHYQDQLPGSIPNALPFRPLWFSTENAMVQQAADEGFDWQVYNFASVDSPQSR